MAIIRYGNHSVIGFGSAGKPQIYFTETSAGIKDWRTGKDSDGRIVLYEYLGKYSASEPLKVPDKYGLTTINDYRSGSTTTASNTPFYNNPNVISVDLKNVPFKNNSMRNAFYNCQNLTSVNGINKNITNMSRTFYECYNLNQNIQIPSSVTNMSETFMFCPNLNQNIQIPSSVTDMSDTFYYCYDLNQNIQIPSSVTNMSQTFSYCYNLNQNIQIPSSVTNMSGTFYYCYDLNQNIQIPSSVTSMAWTFSSCQNLNQNIQIPSSVTNMSGTFTSCTNLNQNIQIPNSVTDMYHTFTSCTNLSSRINILSQNIANAAGCFSSTSLPKDVYIPYTYDNGTYTKTYNSFNSAGYFGGINGVTMHDLNSTSGGGDYDGGGDTDPTPDRGDGG